MGIDSPTARRRRRRVRKVTAPMKASRLEVHHHDDGEPTVYEDVYYWPWGGGSCLSILDEHGNELVKHTDVLNTLVGAPT